MIGPLVGLVTGGARLLVGCTDQLRLLTRILVILLAGLLALVSHREARHWQNSDILWTYTTAMNKEAWPAIVGLGDIRFASGDFEGAALHYRRAAELHPALISTWHYRDAMMEILVRQRKYAEAFETLEAAFAGNEDQIGRQPVHDVFAKKTKAVQKAQCLIEQLQRVGPDDSERNTFSRELSEWLDQQIAQPTSDDL
jgi:tetratricopeptide (TPR) repeat protein